MRRGRAVLLGAVLLAAVAPAGGPAGAVPGPDQEAAQAAAEEIAAARDRADEAAAAYFEARSELEVLGDRAAQLEAEQADLRSLHDGLRSQVDQIAVERFMASGTSGIPLLTSYRLPSEQLQAEALVRVATQSSADVLDAYEAVRDDLDANAEELAETQEELARSRDESAQLQRRAEDEVVVLEEVEAQRLQDEQVQLALAAMRRQEEQERLEAERLAEEQRQREAQAAAEQAAQQAAAAAAQAEQAAQEAQAEQTRQAEQAAAAQAQQAAQAAQEAAAAAQRAADEQAGAEAAATQPAAPAPLPAAPTPAADPPAAAPVDPPPAPGGGGGGGGGGRIICPVQGSMSYSDTWGSPRSGGRSHQGVDLIARTGIPLVAVVSGTVQMRQNSLGGNALWVNGDDGNRYYYAHLSRYEGSNHAVAQGEIIGYVGSTGNAGVPHLHFEVHPGGGAAVNPYPWVRAAGC